MRPKEKIFNDSLTRQNNYSSKKLNDLSELLKDAKKDLNKTNKDVQIFGSRLKEVENYMSNHEDRMVQLENAMKTIQYNQKEMFEQTVAVNKAANNDGDLIKIHKDTDSADQSTYVCKAIRELKDNYTELTANQSSLDTKLDKIMSAVSSLTSSN